MKLLEPVISRQTVAVFPQLSLYKIRPVDKTPFPLFSAFPDGMWKPVENSVRSVDSFFPAVSAFFEVIHRNRASLLLLLKN